MHVRPNKHARRAVAAVAAIVCIALVSTTAGFASHDFEDVPNSNPFHDDIDWMADLGISEGYDDGTFRPGEPVTRQAMSAFMHRLYDTLRPVQVDRAFHVYAQCAATSRYAVIAANGTFIRGSAGTSSTKLSTGTYEVQFNTNVTTCAWLASVGVTGSNGSSTGVANVAGRGANANALFITTYDNPS